MDKITFEDGQLTKKGYVVIDDREYLITEAQYDGATPLSAYILNKMQDNIETAIGEVSSFDPVIVEELPTENIQEKTMYLVLANSSNTKKIYNAYIYKENEWKEIGSTDLTVNLIEKSYKVTLTEKVEAGGTITLPANYKVGSDRLDVFFNGEKLIKAIDDDSQGHYYEVGTEDMSSNTIKLTSDWFAGVGDVFEFSIRTNGEGQAEEVVVDSIPIGTVIDYEGDTVPEGYEEVEEVEELETCKLLGSVNNEDKTITLSNDKLSNYKFLVVSSGYGLYRSIAMAPVTFLKYLGSSGKLCNQYVKTYNGYGFTSISYVDDTSFKINGAVITDSNPTDTTTMVYGVK